MLDLETMGLRPNAAIIAIGAACFTETNIVSTFETPVSLKSCTDLGLSTDQSTIDWWSKQSSAARARWQTEDAPDLLTALRAFSDWLSMTSTPSQRRVWGNGADFDLPIITSAYRVVDADAPWKYYNQRCFRTVKSMFEVPNIPRQGVYHAAMDDAVYQAQILQSICKLHKIQLK